MTLTPKIIDERAIRPNSARKAISSPSIWSGFVVSNERDSDTSNQADAKDTRCNTGHGN